MRVSNIHGPNDVRIDEFPDPTCGRGDVVIRMRACGLCGTDVTFTHLGGLPLGGPRPMPLGHEPAGEVVEVGEGVRDLEVGQRVTFNPSVGEGDVYGCGGAQGALSDLVVVHGAALGGNVFPIPDEVPFEVAALTEPLSVARHAVNRAMASPEHSAVVFGAGPVGVGIVAWLKLLGVPSVVSVDLSPARLELASQLGADHVVAGDDDVVARLRELHGGGTVQGARVASTDIWIDAAGAPEVVDTIVRGAPRFATAVIVAVHKAPVPVDLVSFLTKEMSLTSSMAYPTEFGEVAQALASNWRMFAPMISDRLPLDRVVDAIALAGSADARGKVTVMI